MVKLLKITLIFLLLLLLAIAFSRHTLCRALLSKVIKASTDAKFSIGNLHLDALNSKLHIEELLIYNPPEFKNKVLVKTKRIFMQYDLGEYLKGRLHFRQLDVELAELNIIRDRQGNYNLDILKKKTPQAKSKQVTKINPEAKPKVKKRKTKQARLIIDYLRLGFEKVTYLDYGANDEQAAVIILTMSEPLVFHNVSNLRQTIDAVVENILPQAALTY